MIEIKSVNKIYKLKKKKDVNALTDINLILPDKGMIFVVGKSGSGKSTLLNLLGGLDKPSSGEIIVNGNNITKMKKYELTRYRSSHLGFIFQDYHILKNLTVKENIELSLDINNKEYHEKISKIIQQVDMAEYADRYPKELSGGQQQRIAVARALIKDASIILCDEPTGNLDKKTTTQILDLLKKISQEKLVIIVSHSVRDAQNYGDRIIELYDGKIYRDRCRSENYKNEFKIENNTVYLPHYDDLNPNELIQINEAIANNQNIKFKQIGNRFFDTEITISEQEKIIFEKPKLSSKGFKKLYKLFFNKKFRFIFNIILISLLLVCFSIFQSFLNFDANTELSKSLTKHNVQTVPLQKGSVSSEGSISLINLKRISDDEIQVFKDNGYSDNIYVKYNNSLPILTNKIDHEGNWDIKSIFSMLYCTETLGTINAKEKMVIDMYGKDGNINYVAKASEIKDYGVYITDYVADSIMLNRKDITSYDLLLGKYYYLRSYYGYINGIIETGYREKYNKLFNEFEKFKKDGDANGFYNKILNDNQYSDFLMEAMNFLAYGYSFVDDYSKTIETEEYRNHHTMSDYIIQLNDDKQTKVTSYKSYYNKSSLAPNEIELSVELFNKLFGTNYTKDSQIQPMNITFKFYDTTEEQRAFEYERTYIMNRFSTNSTNYINLNESLELRKYDIIKYGIYLSNHDDIANMINVATDNNFIINSVDATKLSTINRVLEIFGKFFIFIELFFLVIIVIFVFNMGKQAIKKNKYEIGVLKAIGLPNLNIVKQYLLQCSIISVFICFTAYIGMYLGTMVGNSVLVKAFEVILDTSFFDLKLINFFPKLAIFDLLIIVVLSIISYLLPQFMLLRIKPIDIIRARE